MNIVCGIDLVYLPRFKKSLKSGGENFLRRIYREQELIKTDPVHLAGIFAAKEAIIKALSLPTDSWHNINIIYKSNGSPQVEMSNVKCSPRGEAGQMSNCSLSISHDGNYVIAQFTAIYE